MSVAASDLRVYGAANMPESDTGTVGGAVDLSIKVVFTDLSANDTIDFVSDDAGDTDQVYRAHGLSAAGARVTEDFSLGGLSIKTGSTTFERVNKVVKQSGSALLGTVTITKNTGGATLITMESVADAGAGTEIEEVRKPFYNAASDPDATKDLYEKVFYRNNDASMTLIDAIISLMDAPVFSSPTATTVDVTSTVGQKVLSIASTTGFTSGLSVIIGSGTARQEAGKIDTVSAGVSITLVDNLKYEHTSGQADAVAKSRITLDVEAPLDGTDTSTSRVTEPVGYGYTFDATDHDVANLQNHTAGSVQGLWLKLELDAAQSPLKDTLTLREWGNTA